MYREVLTIREVLTSEDYRRATSRYRFTEFGVFLSFDELGHDWSYSAQQFRPLVSTGQDAEAEDIAYFNDILRKAIRTPGGVQ